MALTPIYKCLPESLRKTSFSWRFAFSFLGASKNNRSEASSPPAAGDTLDHPGGTQEEKGKTKALEWRTLICTAREEGLARARHARRKLDREFLMTRREPATNARGTDYCSCRANIPLPPPRRSVVSAPHPWPPPSQLVVESGE